MFADRAKIFLRSGKGGDGNCSFRRELYVPNGGQDGGDGGRGGDLIFEVDEGLNTLIDYRHKRKYAAGDGEEGGKRKCHGKDGKDLVLRVPEGTVIKESKLDLGTWGIIILLLKIWDAINDPIMGALMDALKPGKRGKFKTYIYYGSFVLLFSGALCFLPIPSAPYPIKVLVCVVGYLIWDMAYTVVNVPYGAMNAAITTDPTERAQLSTYRGIGSMIANIVVLITLPLLCYDKDNNLIGSRMFIVALVLGIIGFAAFQILIKGTVERVAVSHEPQEKVKFNYFESLSAFLKNKAVVAITIASIALIIMQIGLSSANQIVFQSYFKNAKLSGILGLATMIPSLIVIPLVKPTVQRFGKREAAAAPMLIGILAAAGIVFLPITPDNTGMMIYIILAVLINSSCIFFSTVVWALVADSVDYQELQTGK